LTAITSVEASANPLRSSSSRPAAPAILAVPAEAVLTTGLHQLVYVEREPGQYHVVEPKLGPRAGDYYPVLEGLAPGDRVVVRGNFLVDSQFQVTGKYSLLNPPSAAGPTAEELAALDQLSSEDRELALAQKVCPVTGAKLGSMGKPYKTTIGERVVFLCCKGCERAVQKDPEGILEALGEAPADEFAADERAALNELPPADRALAAAQKVCPITGERLGSMGMPYKMSVGSRVLFLCCEGCKDGVQEDPEGVLKKLDELLGTKTAGRPGKQAQ
jgi:hypothetical protein